MISRATSSYQSVHQGLQMFPNTEDLVLPSEEIINSASASGSGSGSHSSSLLFNLSILKDKLSEVQTLVSDILSPNQRLPESTSMAISSMNSTIQEIIVTATSMMLTCQHMAFTVPPGTSNTTKCTTNKLHQHELSLPHSINFGNISVLGNIGTDISDHNQGLFSSTESEALDWFSESYNNNNDIISTKIKEDEIDQSIAISENNTSRGDEVLNELDEGYKGSSLSPKKSDIIELDAADLLAKYTHYCQVCGKGFKRDANLRMHMRAHGDEYKTNAALSNPTKNKGNLEEGGRDKCLMNVKPKRYSCPQEGCRWNRKHAKFQPLKSIICAKNHYKRSHCPKMYVCKKCNQKQFSVLSDLRTHEKHCGDLKWQCSCGTSFSRKDKLMGHLALFVGHQPAINNGVAYSGKLEQHTLQMQIDGSSR